jgi:hypothetical protein
MTSEQIARFAADAVAARQALYPATATIGSASYPCAFSRIRRERSGMVGGFAPERAGVVVFPDAFPLTPGTRVTIGGEVFLVSTTAVSKLGSGMRAELDSPSSDMT